jgi:hypothetical protein
MSNFLSGVIAMGYWTAALFFLRFWRETADRLFALFAVAFVLLGVTRTVQVMLHEVSEARTYAHWVRLAAFVLILAAIIDKNRR